MKLDPIGAVVAAAGQSRRMGRPKQLLPWGEGVVIQAVVNHLAAAGAEPVICVVGHRGEEVAAALAGTGAHILHNPDYRSTEMLRSYQLGVETLLETGCPGALLALGDQPHLPVAVIRQILEQAQASLASIVIPSHNMRRGHPIYLPRRFWRDLLQLGQSESLRDLLNRCNDAIMYVNVDTDAIRRDMDAPEDYEALRTRKEEP
ncbi:MAG: nucleotidyltransferase family protein [Caldilineae bacterium]|nr:MAG: nucleotidyltransferase family protein [Caldilineae bacterium]